MRKIYIAVVIFMISMVAVSNIPEIEAAGNKVISKYEKTNGYGGKGSMRLSKEDLRLAAAACEVPEEAALPTAYYDVAMDNKIQDVVFRECDKTGIVPDLVMAVIGTESGYRPNIISSTDDYGLMQINSCNHGWLAETLGIDDFLDEEQNIKAGVYMLSQLWHKYDGDVSKVLMAYNCGEGGATKLWSQGIFETSYSKKVLAQMEKLEYVNQ